MLKYYISQTCRHRLVTQDRSNARSNRGFNMICAYILKCNNNTYYVGSTNNMKRRLTDHNTGQNRYTRTRLPTKLVFTKEFDNLTEARKYEYFIKRQRNRNFYSRLINGEFV